jgi:hypothetical protein
LNNQNREEFKVKELSSRAAIFGLLATVLFSSGCADPRPGSVSVEPTPTPTSQVARQACSAIRSEIPGLNQWIKDVQSALEDIPDISGLSQSERVVANRLLQLHYQFLPEIKDAILERAPDIRQQGPGCIQSFDDLIDADRGIPLTAVQILMCSLNERINVAFANAACPSISASFNVANVVRGPLTMSEQSFLDPSSEFLQNLRPWQIPSDDDSAYESYLSRSEATACELWSGSFEVDSSSLVSLLENLNYVVYKDVLPADPVTAQPIPQELLTQTTQTFYYGTPKQIAKESDAIIEVFRFSAIGPMGSMRNIFGSDEELSSLGLDKICAQVNSVVDVVGRAGTDKYVPGSLGDGYLAKAYEGFTLCPQGTFGSDVVACTATRFFGMLPKLVEEWSKLHEAYRDLSSFVMISEHGSLP